MRHCATSSVFLWTQSRQMLALTKLSDEPRQHKLCLNIFVTYFYKTSSPWILKIGMFIILCLSWCRNLALQTWLLGCMQFRICEFCHHHCVPHFIGIELFYFTYCEVYVNMWIWIHEGALATTPNLELKHSEAEYDDLMMWCRMSTKCVCYKGLHVDCRFEKECIKKMYLVDEVGALWWTHVITTVKRLTD